MLLDKKLPKPFEKFINQVLIDIMINLDKDLVTY